MTQFPLASWSDLARFQLEIAKRWLSRGDESSDIFAKFYFYFAGLNALYYLWAKVDGVEGKEELDRVVNLTKKFGDDRADHIIHQAKTSLEYFRSRGPIQDMRRRTSDDPSTGSTTSQRVDTRKALASPHPAQQVEGLVRTIYFVRSNLVHGSKSTSGDDQELITRSTPALRTFLEEAMTHTQHALGVQSW